MNKVDEMVEKYKNHPGLGTSTFKAALKELAAHYEGREKWISVKDKPIPTDTNIFVCDVGGCMANVFYRNEKWWFEIIGSREVKFPYPITHWQPLPTLPKEKDICEQKPKKN